MEEINESGAAPEESKNQTGTVVREATVIGMYSF